MTGLPRSTAGRTAIAFTLTIGLVVPALMMAWLTRALAPGPAVTEHALVTTPAPSARAPMASEVHSAWVSQSGPALILVDDTAELAIVYRNTGSVPWIRGTTSEARLGIARDDPTLAQSGYAVDWPLPTRPAVQAETVVPPGALATFSFVVRGEAAGRLVIPVRLVIDGVTWLEDEGAHFELVIGATSRRPTVAGTVVG